MVKERAKGMASRFVLMALVALLVASAFGAGPALAARPAGKGGGKPTPPPSVTLTVSPNPVPAWGYIYTVSGTGFSPYAAVNFVRGGLVSFVRADSSGNASTTFQSWDPGTVTVNAYQYSGKSWVLAGSVTFNVVQT